MRPRTVTSGDGQVRRVKITPSPCGKLAYSSRKLALSTAAIQARATGEQIEAYKCTRGCHAWHIGHPAGSRTTAVA